MRRFAFLLIYCVLAFSTGLLSAQTDSERFPAGEDYYLEASVEGDETVFVGQQVIYALRIYVLDTPGARSNIFETLPAFDGFWRAETFETRNPPVTTINGLRYVVQELFVPVYPLLTGELTIESARLEVTGNLFRDVAMFESNPVSLEVVSLPEAVPDGFSGAVGQFSLDVSVDRVQTALGEPLVLEISLTGQGNLEQIPAPELRLPDGWRAFEDESLATLDVNIAGLFLWERSFTYLLVPNRAGTVEFAPVVFAHFDPSTSDYVTLTGPAFTVDVLAAADGTTSLASPQELEMAFAPELKTISMTSSVSAPMWWLWLVPLGGPLLLLLSTQVKAWRRRWRISRQQSQALRRAKSQMRRLADKKSGEYTALESAILGYCWDKLGYTQDDGQDTVKDALHNVGLDWQLVESLMVLLQQVEAARYMPSGSGPTLTVLVKRAVPLLETLDRKWETPR